MAAAQVLRRQRALQGCEVEGNGLRFATEEVMDAGCLVLKLGVTRNLRREQNRERACLLVLARTAQRQDLLGG
jgi:hypothetical protein